MAKGKKHKAEAKKIAPVQTLKIDLDGNLPEDSKGKCPFYETYHETEYIAFHDCRKNISLKDKGASIYNLVNDQSKEIVCYEIDGKLISSTEVDKCDYGLYTEDDLLILVELKGSDYGHAIDQISSTINILLTQPKVKVSRLCGRVVLNKTRVPDIVETKERQLKHLLKTKYKGTLKKQSRVMSETLSEI